MSMDGRYDARSQEGGAAMSKDGRTGICSCNTCTSTIHGGRMTQGARKAVRVSMDGRAGDPENRELVLCFFLIIFALL